MKHSHPGERIRQFREHFKLSQEALGEAIEMSRSNISKIEAGKLALSNAFLFGMMLRFAVNPEWIKTGQGEMLIAPTDYIANGIELLGAEKFGEGLTQILKEPRFAEIRSVVMAGEMMHLDEEVAAYLRHIVSLRHQGDERVRTWLIVQLDRAFPEVGERLKKEKVDLAPA